MKKIQILIILLLSVLIGKTQITKDSATQIVKSQLLGSDTASINLFVKNNILNANDTIFSIGRDTITNPYNQSWVFFSDDIPIANWAHSSRYIFVNATSGVYTTIERYLYPAYLSSDFEKIIEFMPTINDTIPREYMSNPFPKAAPNAHLYAVLIIGYINEAADHSESYWGDVSILYNTLIDVYGYTKENIIVLYAPGNIINGGDLDGDGIADDIDGAASSENIYQTFGLLKNEMGPDDQLFVFINGSGVKLGSSSYILLPPVFPPSYFWDHELAYLVSQIDCAQMIFMLHQSYPGGFYYKLLDFELFPTLCKNRSIMTAVDPDATLGSGGSSHNEVWLSNRKFNEFVYYWTAAARGFYPDDNQPWKVKVYNSNPCTIGNMPFRTIQTYWLRNPATGNLNPFGIESNNPHPLDYNPDANYDGNIQMNEAFNYANNFDTWSQNGYYYPFVEPQRENYTEIPHYIQSYTISDDIYTLSGLAGHIKSNLSTGLSALNYMVGGNLFVDGGYSLNIAPTTTIYFTEKGKLISQPFSKIIIDNAHLKPADNTITWKGIELIGDCNYPQTKDYQGYVELKNTSIIEGADIGILCKQTECIPSDFNEYYSGGVIDANGSVFRNNNTSISIEPFKPNTDYNSIISNCTFEYPNEIGPSLETPIVYIKLNGVNKVNIFDNTFTAEITNPFNLRGIGIDALDATFKLNDIFIPTDPNGFSNLTYGIRCCNTSSSFNPVISKSTFSDCWRSIYLSGVTDANVLSNTITYQSLSSAENEEAYGIYLDNCTGYNVEGNVLTRTTGGATPEFGIIINNSGTAANEIYRNEFTEIEIPLNAQNINRSTNGGTGLQLLCNNIIDCSVNDIVVTKDLDHQFPNDCGIRQDQGSYNILNPWPAGNLFTYGASGYLNYRNYTPNVVNYAHYSDILPITYQGIYHYVTPKVNQMIAEVENYDTGIYWDPDDWKDYYCDEKNTGDSKSMEPVENLKEQIKLLQPRIDSASLALKNKMDNGNTSELLNHIKLCTPTGYGKLYSDLKEYSPYLSEEVLLAVIAKQGFQSQLLYNLMLVNTHAAKSPYIMQALQQVQPPLSQAQMLNIKENIRLFSAMEKERMFLYSLISKRDNAYNSVESFYAHDSLPASYVSLGTILVQDPRLIAKYRLIDYYCNNKDTLKADELLGKIPIIFELDVNEKAEHNKYKQLYELKRQLQREGKNYSMLNEQQQQLLINAIINPSLSLTEMNYLNALRQVEGIVIGKTATLRQGSVGDGKSLSLNYREPILKPVENIELITDNNKLTNQYDLIAEGLLEKVLMEENGLKLFPNPAIEEVNILYNVIPENSKISIEIFDVTGRLAGSYSLTSNDHLLKIDTKPYQKGIYYVMLMVDGNRTKVEKLVIQ